MAAGDKKSNETIDYSIEEKIAALYDLQIIDSKIDEINKLKGELPLEVEDLENEVEGLKTRIEKITAEIEELNLLNKQKKDDIEHAKNLIAKYDEQQKNVRNNREFDSLNKEIEYQNLEIQLFEKHIKEQTAEMKNKKALLEKTDAYFKERAADLDVKKAELKSIDEETASEMEELRKQEAKASEKIDKRLLDAYNRIRRNVKNGLAVVTVKRDACGGCFNSIPPQRQFEIRQNRKIIVCEYCGRILVSDLLEEVTEE